MILYDQTFYCDFHSYEGGGTGLIMTYHGINISHGHQIKLYDGGIFMAIADHELMFNQQITNSDSPRIAGAEQ